MNLLADDLTPYLLASGIRWKRNRPTMTAASSIQESNAGQYDLHLALHSNASGEDAYGKNRGILVFYYPGSVQGKRAAELIAEELRKIYPLPQRVAIRATTSLGEVRRSRAPAVLAEIGYHDNYADAHWIEGHREDIAQQLARALTTYFDLPFISPRPPVRGEVEVESGGTLYLRSAPSHSAEILARLPDRAELTIYGEWEGWYVVHWGDLVGYAAAAYIDADEATENVRTGPA